MSPTALAFVLFFVAGLVLAIVRHPRYGLYTYIAVFYIHPPSRWWGSFAPEMRWALIAALVTWIATLRMKDDQRRPSWISTTPAKLLLAMTLWIWVQNLWALDRVEHLDLSVVFTKYLMLFYLIYRLVDTQREAVMLLIVHVSGCAYLGWLALNASVSGRLEGVGGPGINEANAFAMQMATAIMIGSMMVLSSRGWRRLLAFASMPLLLNSIVLAGSRGSFVALLCGGVVLALVKPHAHRKVFYALASLAVVLFVMLAHEYFWSRISSIASGVEDQQDMDQSALSRIVMFEAQVKMAETHLWGTGHRGTAFLSPLYLDERFLVKDPDHPERPGERSSHNTFMTALVEQGVPGALLFAAMWAWCVAEVARVKRLRPLREVPEHMAMLAGVAGALMVVFIAGIFVDYFKAEVQVWLLATLASIGTITRADAAIGAAAELGPKSAASQYGRPPAGPAAPTVYGK
jgi:O-antigen ligase